MRIASDSQSVHDAFMPDESDTLCLIWLYQKGGEKDKTYGEAAKSFP
jgi:hypothetical protein